MNERLNERNVIETYFEGQHLSLYDLKEMNIQHGYLSKNDIPAYPESVEFHVQKVSHVTGDNGLQGILDDSGFRHPADTSGFLWWGLSITSDDIRSAEQRFLRSLFPRTQFNNQLPILKHFTTSKAFQKKSPYGNFRFTFSIRELLYHYNDQLCHGSGPVLRVYETKLFSQEIVYAILVHPRDVHLYDQYPRLPDVGDGVCGYMDGTIWWRCQAPSKTYSQKLKVNRSNATVTPHHKEEYYVWDNVCVAFHMEPGWVLRVNQDRLLNRLSVCKVSEPCLIKPPDTPLSLHQAENILTNLTARMGYAGASY